MIAYCNVCGRPTNSAGNCPVPHIVERFGLEAINHDLMVNVCRLTARCARLEGALRDFIDDEPCDLDHSGACQAHMWFGDGPCRMVRARGAVGP